MNRVRVGVIGCGYWGPNLVRNFFSSPATELVAICDANPVRLESVGRTYGAVKQVSSVDQLLETGIEAVAIATPVSSHHALATRCLEAGLHVLVEKPLAATALEAQALVDLAERKQRVLMVDHTYLFNPAVRRIKELVEYGELGDLYYVDSIRINLGLFQHDVNVVWDLAPHDLSIVDYVLDYQARSISAWGCAHANPDIEDIAYVNVDYGDRMMANFHVNWLSPVKLRQMIFAGSRKSLIYNDLNTTEQIKVYDRGINIGSSEEARHKAQIDYRAGDIWSPHIAPQEALAGVVSHFAQCIREGTTPLSSGHLGLRVVRLLEAATRSIRAQGGRVVLSNGIGVNANANGHARENGYGQRSPDRTRRAAGKKRRDPLLR
jgi:predicted dehydrogenase